MRQFSIISIDREVSSFKHRNYERYRYEKGFKGRFHSHSHIFQKHIEK